MITLRRRASLHWLYIGVAFFILFTLWEWKATSDPNIGSSELECSYHDHPIQLLAAAGRRKFVDLQAKQSTTLTEAVNEYVKRYGRDPPAGFETWYALARQHDFVLIDEFDTIMDSFRPYFGIPHELMQKRLNMIRAAASHRVAAIDVQQGKFNFTESRFVTNVTLPDVEWLKTIPYNFTALLNISDEPMVNVAWEQHRPHMSQSDHGYPLQPESTVASLRPLMNVTGRNGWAVTSHACPSDAPALQLKCPALGGRTSALQIVDDVNASKDVCQNCGLIEQYGMLIRPESMFLARDLVPVLSASKLSHFQDILFPSAYYASERKEYHASKDIPWHKKDNKLYWAGTATGGHTTVENWWKMQRQRLAMKIANGNAESVPVLERTWPQSWRTSFHPFRSLTHLFEVHITRIAQCDPAACSAQREALRVAKKSPLDERDASYKHKFAIDIDGNGFSGRFYRLLQSRSAVIKQTVLKEWHDDRLVPWVHYIPLSILYRELPELARFFAGTRCGEELGERIARDSTEWHDRALRDVDVKLVMFRVLLEYGRLLSG